MIKANIPVRAALRVNSKVDSRTILDSGGAEDMLGNGDMLFLGPGQIEPDRVHGAYVSDEEVNRVCDAWRERGAPDYIDNMAGNFELSSPSGGLVLPMLLVKTMTYIMTPLPLLWKRARSQLPVFSVNSASATTVLRALSTRWRRLDWSAQWAKVASANY